jgi:asparagine synthase (glutamine-hydrolysing)
MFDGMFALAMVDTAARTLLIARDRAGIKPVHYSVQNGMFLFASEIKSIGAALGSGVLKPNLSCLRDILEQGYVNGEVTPFQDVMTLEPGWALEVDLDTLRVEKKQFCDLLSFLEEKTWRAWNQQPVLTVEEELEADLLNSVEAHLVSDAPVGLMCSGGVDSSLIIALAHKINPDLEMYHSGWDSPSSEEKYATLVARHLRVPIHVSKTNRENFLRLWPKALYHFEIPDAHQSTVSLYLMSKQAREHGVKVLLSGEGADELFGGYDYNLKLHEKLRWRKLLSLPKIRVIGNMVTTARPLTDGPQGPRWFADVANLTTFSKLERALVSQTLFFAGGAQFRRGIRFQEKLSFVPEPEQIAHSYLLDLLHGNLLSLLVRNDRMAMWASVETRIPFLSNNLLAKWVAMPMRFRVRAKDGEHGKKYMLRRIASKYLPKEIAYRRKTGFAVPISNYLKPREILFENGFLENQFRVSGKAIYEIGKARFGILFILSALEIWGRVFFHQESAEALGEWLLSTNG